MTKDERKCALFGHIPGPWVHYPIPPEPLSLIQSVDVIPTFERIRYVSKRQCTRCGEVQIDRSNA